MRLFSMLCAGLLTFSAIPASAAEPFMFDCKLVNKDKRSNWISERTAFIVSKDGEISVIDNAILHVHKEAVSARVRKSGDKLQIRWSLIGATDTTGTRVPRFAYTASLNTKTNKVDVVAKAIGFDTRFYASGACSRRKAK